MADGEAASGVPAGAGNVGAEARRRPLRLAALLPADDRAHIDELSIKQLIALRFASDAELPDLVRKTLTQNLEPKAIKESITTWRPDYDRV